MKLEEAKLLKLDDRVQWGNDSKDQGTIIYVTDECVAVKWDNDGIIGVFRFAGFALQTINTIKKEGQDALTSVS